VVRNNVTGPDAGIGMGILMEDEADGPVLTPPIQ